MTTPPPSSDIPNLAANSFLLLWSQLAGLIARQEVNTHSKHKPRHHHAAIISRDMSAEGFIPRPLSPAVGASDEVQSSHEDGQQTYSCGDQITPLHGYNILPTEILKFKRHPGSSSKQKPPLSHLCQTAVQNLDNLVARQCKRNDHTSSSSNANRSPSNNEDDDLTLAATFLHPQLVALFCQVLATSSSSGDDSPLGKTDCAKQSVTIGQQQQQAGGGTRPTSTTDDSAEEGADDDDNGIGQASETVPKAPLAHSTPLQQPILLCGRSMPADWLLEKKSPNTAPGVTRQQKGVESLSNRQEIPSFEKQFESGVLLPNGLMKFMNLSDTSQPPVEYSFLTSVFNSQVFNFCLDRIIEARNRFLSGKQGSFNLTEADDVPLRPTPSGPPTLGISQSSFKNGCSRKNHLYAVQSSGAALDEKRRNHTKTAGHPGTDTSCVSDISSITLKSEAKLRHIKREKQLVEEELRVKAKLMKNLRTQIASHLELFRAIGDLSTLPLQISKNYNGTSANDIQSGPGTFTTDTDGEYYSASESNRAAPNVLSPKIPPLLAAVLRNELLFGIPVRRAVEGLVSLKLTERDLIRDNCSLKNRIRLLQQKNAARDHQTTRFSPNSLRGVVSQTAFQHPCPVTPQDITSSNNRTGGYRGPFATIYKSATQPHHPFVTRRPYHQSSVPPHLHDIGNCSRRSVPFDGLLRMDGCANYSGPPPPPGIYSSSSNQYPVTDHTGGLDSVSDFYTGSSLGAGGGGGGGVSQSYNTGILRQNGLHRQYNNNHHHTHTHHLHRRNESNVAHVSQTIAEEDQTTSMNEMHMNDQGEDNNTVGGCGEDGTTAGSPKQRKSHKSTTSGGPFFYSLVRNLFTGNKQSKQNKSRKESTPRSTQMNTNLSDTDEQTCGDGFKHTRVQTGNLLSDYGGESYLSRPSLVGHQRGKTCQPQHGLFGSMLYNESNSRNFAVGGGTNSYHRHYQQSMDGGGGGDPSYYMTQQGVGQLPPNEEFFSTPPFRPVSQRRY